MNKKAEKKEQLKELIRRLHAGAKPEELKEEFKAVISKLGPQEIARVEEELIKEGMSMEEVHRLCDVHMAVFKDSLEKQEIQVPPGHPLHILMEEHKMMLRFAEELRQLAKVIRSAPNLEAAQNMMEQLPILAERFKEAENHYLREENVLFPYLEKHGVSQPPAIMWMEHDRIREIKKNLLSLIDSRASAPFHKFAADLESIATHLAETLAGHFYKENKILFPTALGVIEPHEWKETREQFDELGYTSFSPERPRIFPEKMAAPGLVAKEKGVIELETGSLSKEELEAMLNALPVDLSFVDKDDTVRYFSEARERIFTRTKAVIGRKVQQCHPQKSIHLVNKILEDFKAGRREVAAFWIHMAGKFIHIRYFPVRNKKGEYLGCVEVTQEISEIQKLKGENRLL